MNLRPLFTARIHLLSVAFLAISACSRPTRGILEAHPIHTPPPREVIATPAPELPKSEPAPSKIPSPTPSPTPSPKTPSPTTEPGSHWPTAQPKPAPKPAPNVNPVTPKPIPPGPKSTTMTPDEEKARIPVQVGSFTMFARPFAQSFGLYYKGHMEKADALPDDGPGFVKIFRAREFRYGSLDLISLIENAAQALHQDIPAAERLQIGDISGRDGGANDKHASHQNGLDADIVFLKKDRREMNPNNVLSNSTGFDEDFVAPNGRVSANFDVDGTWKLIQIIVSSGRVDRIFIDQHLKKKFCEYAVEKGMRKDWGETLRKLRHADHHQDHFHIRLTCPAKSGACQSTPEIPSGDGCDSLVGRDGRAGISTDVEGLTDAPSDPNETGC